MRLAALVILVMPGVLGALERLGAPNARLIDPVWRERAPAAETTVDHASWGEFLARYLTVRENDANRVDYAAVTPADRAALGGYIARLEGIDPATLSGPVQLAYWINLYNAATVALVLEHHPVASIREIGSGLFEEGPWSRDVVTVKGRALSLNDIEHGIIRPLWPGEPRIHYAVNCAAVGCPDLVPMPYRGARIEAQLAAAERAFVDDPRGVRRAEGGLVLSKIWLWYREDFAETEAALLTRLRRVATGRAAEALASAEAVERYAYDWALNGPVDDSD